jgi:enoyl-CoA hydratase
VNPITFECKDNVLSVVLSRPEKLNALTMEMLKTMEKQLIASAEDNKFHVVLVTGRGRAFCSGADIADASRASAEDMWRYWCRVGNRVFDLLARMPQPTIAAIHGFALGGGLELALAADMRIAAEGAKLGAPEVTIGAVPGWGCLRRLQALIGPGRARQMVFLGRPIDAVTAAAWGLVNEVVPFDRLSERAWELATAIAANPAFAVQICKDVMNIDREAKATSTVVDGLAGYVARSTSDNVRGLQAFLDKEGRHGGPS